MNAGEPVSSIDIFLDDVKHKVIQPAKRPDGNRQQEGRLQLRVLEQNRGRCQGSRNEKQKPFQVDESGTLQIAHSFNSAGKSAKAHKSSLTR